LYAITYTEIALGLVRWEVWAPDAATADAAIRARAGADSFPGDYAADTPLGGHRERTVCGDQPLSGSAGDQI
jgi:hypothetical protein